MRQSITKKQWDELNKKEVEKFTIAMKWGDYGDIVYWEFVNIGILIEFLGDDLEEISRVINPNLLSKKPIKVLKSWWLALKDLDEMRFKKKELIDALWESCKYKLRSGN